VRQAEGLELASCQQPELTCKALELVARLFTAADTVAGASAESLNHFCAKVLQLCEYAAGQLSKAVLQADGLVRQQQLFGLVLSCGKLAAVAVRSRQPDSLLMIGAWITVMSGVQLSSGEAVAGGSSSSSSGSGDGSSSSDGKAAAARREVAYMTLVSFARGFLLAG
jgi:hypothetical protein